MKFKFVSKIHVEEPGFYYYNHGEPPRFKYIVYDTPVAGPYWAIKFYNDRDLTPEEQEIYINLAIARFGGTKKQNP